MRISIVGHESAELPLRVLNLLAQQGIDLDQVIIEREKGQCRIRLDARPVETALRKRIIEKIGSMVLVRAVEILETAPERQAAASP